MTDATIETGDDQLFCRFAISGSADGTTACIMPLSSDTGLLPHQDRWKHRQFGPTSQACLFDLSPKILGPVEGFVQAGYVVHSVLGIDPENHATWKVS